MPQDKNLSEISVLIDKKGQRLFQLEKKKAVAGFDADPSVEIEIEQITQEIENLKRELEFSDAYHLGTLPLPLQRYDNFFERLSQKLPSNEINPIKFRKSILDTLMYALDAEQVFVASYTGARWQVVFSATSNNLNGDSDSELNDEVQHLIYRAVKYYDDNIEKTPNSYPGVTVGQHQSSSHHYLFIPFPNSSPKEVLVINGVPNGIELDIAISVILTDILDFTENLIRPHSSASIQMHLLNSLKQKFANVSDYMYTQQFQLFQEQLNKVVMYYEPIVSLSHYPYICRWEALARNEETKKVPADLFKTCELWGKRFQTELDIYCLNAAVTGYRSLPKRTGEAKDDFQKNSSSRKNSASPLNNYRTRVGDILPLSINVYPETLVRTAYQSAILNIAKSKLIPLDKLTLEISEKSPLPAPTDKFENNDEVKWFRNRLNYYASLGITFSIDDYGIGFASASRLSRLEPAVVKIDRDALLHARGSYTIQHVLQLAQDSMGKMIIIMEGFDDESKLSLAELYQMGIRYVQGHAFGMPVPATEIYRLEVQDEDDIINKLGL